MAILDQERPCEPTDSELLLVYCLQVAADREFFSGEAIDRALRSYAKDAPAVAIGWKVTRPAR